MAVPFRNYVKIPSKNYASFIGKTVNSVTVNGFTGEVTIAFVGCEHRITAPCGYFEPYDVIPGASYENGVLTLPLPDGRRMEIRGEITVKG